MFSRSAWEPRWKYQVGRQHLCMNAAAEAALEGEWFDEPQPVPVEPHDLHDLHDLREPQPERVKRKYVKKAEKTRALALQQTWKLADIPQRGDVL